MFEKNRFRFERDWVRLSSSAISEKVEYLQQVKLENLPKIFRESLTSELIADLLGLVEQHGDETFARDMLRALPKCRRFPFLLSCCSKSEMATIGAVFSLAKFSDDDEIKFREQYDEVPECEYIPRDQVPTVALPPSAAKPETANTNYEVEPSVETNQRNDIESKDAEKSTETKVERKLEAPLPKSQRKIEPPMPKSSKNSEADKLAKDFAKELDLGKLFQNF